MGYVPGTGLSWGTSLSLSLPLLLDQRLQRRREVHVRELVAAEPRVQFAQRDARAPLVLEREACLEVGLRLAPQRFALAQQAERVQQRRVVRMRGEPALGRLELARRVADAALRVQHGEARIPVALEAAR